MTDTHITYAWQRLKHSLQALAMSPEIQIALHPDFVVLGDELALDFANWREVLLSNDVDLSVLQRDLLERIDARLDAMSGAAPLWTHDALRDGRDGTRFAS